MSLQHEMNLVTLPLIYTTHDKRRQKPSTERQSNDRSIDRTNERIAHSISIARARDSK